MGESNLPHVLCPLCVRPGGLSRGRDGIQKLKERRVRVQKWNEEGQPEDLVPAEVAAIDQMSAAFRALRERLLAIHAQATATVRAEPDQAPEQHMGVIQVELHQVMVEAFGGPGGTERVFSFIMYLINDLSSLYQRDDRLSHMINSAGLLLNDVTRHLNQMGDAIGMEEPVAQGQE